jgi:hypothetical protein
MPRVVERRRLERLDDLALARQLLSAIPDRERIALDRYYGGLETAAQIEAALCWRPGTLADLRLELRKRFFIGLLGRDRLGMAIDQSGEPA